MATQAPSAAGKSPSEAAGAETQEPVALPSPKKVREGKAQDPTKTGKPGVRADGREIKPIKTKVQIPGVDTGFNRASAFDTKLAQALGRDEETGEQKQEIAGGESEEFSARIGKTKQPAQERAAQKEESAAAEGEGARPTPPRGEDGRFQKAVDEQESAAEQQMAEEAGLEAESAAPAETPEPPPEEVDEAFESDERVKKLRGDHEKLLQQHRTLQGMFKPIQVKYQHVVTEQHAAAKSAHAWKARAETLERQLNELRSGNSNAGNGGQPHAAPPVAGGSAQGPAGRSAAAPDEAAEYDAIAKQVDWEMYRSVKEQGDDAAAVWLIHQAAAINKRNAEELAERLRAEWRAELSKPEQEKQEKAQIAERALEVFSRVADIKNADGSDAFPELSDEKLASEVGRVWVQSGEDPNALLTPLGVIKAIGLFRVFHHGDADEPTTTTADAGGEEQEEQESEEQEGQQENGGRDDHAHVSARALRGMPGSRASLPTRPAGSSRLTGNDEGSRIRQSFRDRTGDVDPVLGFPRRARR